MAARTHLSSSLLASYDIGGCHCGVVVVKKKMETKLCASGSLSEERCCLFPERFESSGVNEGPERKNVVVDGQDLGHHLVVTISSKSLSGCKSFR